MVVANQHHAGWTPLDSIEESKDGQKGSVSVSLGDVDGLVVKL
jgi:hypothetical protein